MRAADFDSVRPGARMRAVLRASAVVLSIALAVQLCWGYAGVGLVGVTQWRSWVASPDYRAVSIEVADGQFKCLGYVATSTAWVATVSSPGTHLLGHFHYHPRVGLRQAAYGFEAHVVLHTPAEASYVLAAPIWCTLVPCGIAPLLWLRAWQRQRCHAEGFPVLAGR